MIRKQKIKKRLATGPCPFCEGGKTPDYKDYKSLVKFLTPRSAIIPKKYSGVCSAHQRQLAVAIKRGRHLGLLPFAPSV